MNYKPKSATGWMLCPSKSFPGRFYYFNGLTGETAWSGEIDNKHECRDNTINVDKYHSYPEPSSPPADFITYNNLFNVNQPFIPKRSPPNIYPRCVMNPQFLPNIIWQPVPMASNSVHPNILQPIIPPNSDKRRTINQSTQTWQNINSPSFKTYPNTTFLNKNHNIPNNLNDNNNLPNIQPRKRPFQSPDYFKIPNQPLTKKFSALTQTNSNPNERSYGDNPKLKKTIHSFTTNTYDKTEHPQESNQQLKKPIHSFTNTSNDEELITNKRKYVENNLHLKKTIHSVNENNPLLTKPIHSFNENNPQLKKSIHSFSSKTFDEKEAIQVSQPVFGSKLDCTDLRHVLVARRRLYMKLEEPKETSAATTHNQTYGESKKVTFNIDDVDDEEIMNISTIGDDTETPIFDTKYLSQLSDDSMTKDRWYILPDLQVLLQHFKFFKLFIQSDPKCRIFIPNSLYKTIESQSIGDCRGRPETMIARQLLRSINNTDDVIFVQDQESNIVPTNLEDDILNCCILLLQQKYHVVLITIDENLNAKAKSLHLHSYTINEIKDNQNSQFPIFDLKKIDANIRKSYQNIPEQRKVLKECNKATNNSLSNRFTQINAQKTNQTLKHVDIATNPQKINEKAKTDSFYQDLSTNTQLFNGKVKIDNYQSIANNKTKEAFIYDDLSTESEISSHFGFFYENEDKFDDNNDNNLSDSIANTKNKMKRPSIFDISNLEYCPSRQIDTDEKDFTNSIEVGLKKFGVKNKLIEARIKCRIEEWECTLIQIMEDTLTEVLQINGQNQNLKTSPPWTLLEAIEHIKQLYNKGPTVKYIADTLYRNLINIFQSYGKLKYAEPTDFMQVFGYCTILIESLQSVHPTMQVLITAEAMLYDLLKIINNPSMDLDERTLGSNESLEKNNDNSLEEEMSNECVNKANEPEDYIQNYPQQKAEHIWNKSHKPEIQKNNIICTIGKDLKFIKITKNNTMTQDTKTNTKYIDNLKSEVDINDDNEQLVMKIKEFLMILSKFLNMVYDYIYSLITDQCNTKSYRKVPESDEIYSLVIRIIDHLKSIILRESVSGSTESSVLAKAGLDANKYRELITKSLEQTKILEQFLRLLQRNVKFEDLKLPL